MKGNCAHLFRRRPWWFLHRYTWNRWQCIGCGYQTRTYDVVDRMGLRPRHRYMSVAVPGYNTVAR